MRRLALLALALLAGAGPALAEGDGDWPTVGRTEGEQSFSPLARINDKNVGRLGLAWAFDLETDRGVEAAPLEIDGVLYDVTPWNVTTALDARTGRLLWRYDPEVPRRFGRLACCDIVSRGLAAWQGRIILATLDGRLIALDAKTGTPVWTVETVDHAQPYTVTGAPRVFDGKVLIGNAGGEFGVRGYITAYDAGTGRQLWRFHTVPGDPAKGFESPAMALAAATWHGEWWTNGGGGTVYDSIVYDRELHRVYFGTGNGAPWVSQYRGGGGGDNLFVASLLALDLATGAYQWHYQETPGEEWDYDATQPLVLADLTIGGKPRRVVMQASKNGFFYVLDRTDGRLLSAAPFAPVTWASGIDQATGRPVENPAARYGEVPVSVSPGAGGAHNFAAMAFSPLTGLAYFPAVASAMAYAADPDYGPGRGPGNGFAFRGHPEERKRIADEAAAHAGAWLAAWDPVRQKEAWRVAYPRAGSGGVLATAGNLVIEGTIDRTLAIYRADTGERLWQMPVQNVPIGAPITYELDGTQYIAVNAGWGGGVAHVESANYRDLKVGPARLLVFALGGGARLPDFVAAAPPRSPPPPATAPVETVRRGETLYAATCAPCHGAEARGGVKDLRWMSPDSHRGFLDIVLGGARQGSGMASFADRLNRDDAEAIHAYLIARANEDWEHDSAR